MRTKYIGVIGLKGGSGRSTVATNLAGELSKAGPTVLIDCDMPQGSAAAWVTLRAEGGFAGDLTLETADDHRELVQIAERVAGTCEFVVIDGPPRMAEMMRAALVLADLCVVPVGASTVEVWATQDMAPLLAEAEAVRKVPVWRVWTRFRPQTRMAQDLQRDADDVLPMPSMATTLGFRVAYPEALGSGATVAEMPGQTEAREEVRALVAEIQGALRVRAGR